MIHYCQQCGEQFSRPNKGNEPKFCSKECFRKSLVTHGDGASRLYKMWGNMKWRCSHEPRYVALGITVCEEWKDYLVFKAWALEHDYTDDLEIDRENGKLGYSPENCRFVETLAQKSNQGKHKLAKSRFKGVSPYGSNGKWKAESSRRGKGHIGCFDTEIEAAQAYDDYVFSVDPEFAFLNFPERLRKDSNARLVSQEE